MVLNPDPGTVDDPVMATSTSTRRGVAMLAAAATMLTFSASCRTLEPPTNPDVAAGSAPSTTLRTAVPGAPSVVTTAPTTTTTSTTAGNQVPTGTVILAAPPTTAPRVQPRLVIPPAETTTTTVPPTTTTAVGTVLLKVRDTRLGLIIVDVIGHTLYASAADPAGEGLCSGACTAQWVPIPGYVVLTDAGVNVALVGRVTRADGLVQLTYAGLPLYRLHNEPLGALMGHGDGAQWFTVSPEGSLLTG